jgi:hypothetical protein
MKKPLLLSITFISFLSLSKISLAQCNFLTTAEASGDTLHCSGGDVYRSAVAYHPTFELYYSNNAGGTASNETFDLNGNLVQTELIPDYRGFWYNENLDILEGNTWGSGIVTHSVLSNGHLGGTSTPVGNAITPNVQSCGVYDPTADLIYYYDNGVISGQNRSDFSTISPITLTGLSSFSNVILYELMYTGCTGNEIGIYDYISKSLYLFNISTGALSTTVQLPSDVITPSYTGFNFSYANEIVWIYNSTINKWVGYNIYDQTNGIETLDKPTIEIYPNPSNNLITIELPNEETVSLYSITGEFIESVRINKKGTFDVSQLPIGVYIIKTATNTMKFIKN